MRARRRNQHTLKSEINVVPYIDVMLVLLIIFMITTPLLTQGVDIRLPQGQTKAIETQGPDPLIVSVDAEGQLYSNLSSTPTRPLSAEALVSEIAAQLRVDESEHQKRLFLVKGDRLARYEQVMQAMVLLQKAGVSQVGLLTDPQGGN